MGPVCLWHRGLAGGALAGGVGAGVGRQPEWAHGRYRVRAPRTRTEATEGASGVVPTMRPGEGVWACGEGNHGSGSPELRSGDHLVTHEHQKDERVGAHRVGLVVGAGGGRKQGR